MRRLFLLRHADAVHQPGEDRQRPLSSQGRRDAGNLGQKMKAAKLFPQYVVCSPARRTRETYAVLEDFLPETACIYPEHLYNATTETLFRAVRSFTDSYGSALLIGHNPGIQDLAKILARRGDHEMLSTLSRGFRPCTLAVIDFACESWALADPDASKLSHLMVP